MRVDHMLVINLKFTFQQGEEMVLDYKYLGLYLSIYQDKKLDNKHKSSW